MLNPNTILDAMVTNLRSIPELVAELDSDPTKIIGYYDRFPDSTCLRGAILAVEHPGILVVWDGTGPGAGMRGWRHRFRLFLFAKQEFVGDAPRGYGKLFSLIVNGVPAGGTERMINTQILPSCDPMDVPSAQRTQLVIDLEGNTLDFFEVTITYPEIGDN